MEIVVATAKNHQRKIEKDYGREKEISPDRKNGTGTGRGSGEIGTCLRNAKQNQRQAGKGVAKVENTRLLGKGF